MMIDLEFVNVLTEFVRELARKINLIRHTLNIYFIYFLMYDGVLRMVSVIIMACTFKNCLFIINGSNRWTVRQIGSTYATAKFKLTQL